MEAPSTRKVTLTTVTPDAVLGVAVSVTMRFTVAAGGVSVMDEAAAMLPVPPVVPEPGEVMLVVPVPVVFCPIMLLLQAARPADAAAITQIAADLERIPVKVSCIS